ncbi:MAG: hypothetical protein ACMUEM_04040 [Flavobacteriales bacterium AspAUS03]
MEIYPRELEDLLDAFLDTNHADPDLLLYPISNEIKHIKVTILDQAKDVSIRKLIAQIYTNKYFIVSKVDRRKGANRSHLKKRRRPIGFDYLKQF